MEEFMPISCDTTPQLNFATHSIPKNTAGFYDSKGFAQNEMQILGTTISILKKGLEEGLKQIDKAIHGLS
jgi:hypothetical protein